MKIAPTQRNIGRGSSASGYGRWLLAGGLLLPVTFVMSMDRTAMTVVAPVFARDFHLSVTQLSIVLTSFWWAYALFQVPGGLLARRFGPRKMLALAGLWWSVFTFITPYGVVFLGFVVIRLLLGVGQAADWPAAVLTLQRWFPQREQSRGNSLLLCGLYLGSIVGTPLVVWITDGLGWAAVFHLFPAVGVVLAALWWWLVRDEPRATPGSPPKRPPTSSQESAGPWWPCLAMAGVRPLAAVLGDRPAVRVPDHHPELLHHLAADLPGRSAWGVVHRHGLAGLTAVDRAGRRCVRHGLAQRPGPAPLARPGPRRRGRATSSQRYSSSWARSVPACR